MAFEEGFPGAITSWGGETVRVCNPCVPDPNLSPPAPRPFPNLPQYLPQPTGGPQNLPTIWQQGMPPGLPPGFLPSYPLQGHPNQTGGTSNHQHHHHNPNWYAPTAAVPPSPFHTRSSSSSAALPSHPNYHPPSPFYIPSHPPSRPGQLSQPPPIFQSPPLPRRQIAEEDECPICGEELPPKGDNGETKDREAHVESCIKDHMYSSTPTASETAQQQDPQQQQQRTPQRPRVGIPGVEGASGGSSSHSISSSPRPSGSRPRRMTGGRMLVYKATEKDCMGDDSLAVECVICFEEFEVGDDMGRLECLCKFHRVSRDSLLVAA